MNFVYKLTGCIDSDMSYMVNVSAWDSDCPS